MRGHNEYGATNCALIPFPPETEKYAHVTFFFNGGVEKQFPGEERHLIPSPKVHRCSPVFDENNILTHLDAQVPTYDQQPEMSSQGVADKVAEVLRTEKYDFVMCNFAPPDMVRPFSEPRRMATYSVRRSVTQVYTMRLSRPSRQRMRLSEPSRRQPMSPATFFSLRPIMAMPSR